MNTIRTAILIFFLGVSVIPAQIQVYDVAPKITDSRIDTALDDHYAFVNRSVVARGRLVVFFPGTGAIARNYRVFPTVAANLGFHAVGLTYPNDETVNTRCGASATDLDCYASIRGETLDGTDRTPLATVSRANSIENRLVKLLQYLQRQYPQDNWMQFLERTANGDTVPRWRNIIVAGHSQGGGYAGYIATVKRVARSIMFCAMDYNVPTRKMANWITGTKATPQSEFFAVGHLRDELVAYPILSQQAWIGGYGLNAFGAIVNADSARPPYPQTRLFTTNRESSPLGVLLTIGPRHNVPVVDVNTPQEQGRYLLQPVWEYMLTAPSILVSVASDNLISSYTAFGENLVKVFPNPASEVIVVEGLKQPAALAFVNVLGQIVMNFHVVEPTVILDVSSLVSGVYTVRIASQNTVITRPVHVMR